MSMEQNFPCEEMFPPKPKKECCVCINVHCDQCNQDPCVKKDPCKENCCVTINIYCDCK